MAAQDQGAVHGVTADPQIELGTIQWLHDFVHCPHNGVPNVSMLIYAQNFVLTDLESIPGSQPNTTELRARFHMLIVLRHLFQCFWVMHRSGLSLRGEFGASNMLVYTSLEVRMTGVHFSRFTRTDGDLDYAQFVASVEEVFMLRESVPNDIRTWLELIREGVNGYEYLIRYNTALMEPAQAFSWLMASRGLLEQLRFVDPRTFHMIIMMNYELVGWQVDSHCVNTLMQSARGHVDPRTGRTTNFEPNVMGVLTLGRNCSQHSAKYKEKYMVLIIEEDFPGFVARFQLNLFRAGLLPFFHLEATMG